MCANETKVLVTEVPMFAPIIIGTAEPNDSVPEPTIPTITEVVVEEDWTRTVPRIPIASATSGFAVAVNKASDSSVPNNSKPMLNNVIDRTNRYSKSSIARILKATLSVGP
jgi:hypothetical protein